MLINTRPSSYFFSESIFMNPGTSLEVTLASLTDVQVQDIHEGLVTGRLTVDDREALIRELTLRLAKEGNDPAVLQRIKELEESLKKTAATLPSKSQVDDLIQRIKEAKEDLDLDVPDFVKVFKDNL